MNDLENRLRASFQRQVDQPHPVLGVADAAISNGQRRRRAQLLGSGATAVAAAVAVAVLVLPGGGTPNAGQLGGTPTSETTASASADPNLAPQSWVNGLAHEQVSSVTVVAVGSTVVWSDSTKATTRSPAGPVQRITDATPLPDGVLLSTAATATLPGRLLVLGKDGRTRVVATGVGYQHELDPTGTKVAYGLLQQSEVVVADLATGRVLQQVALPVARDTGDPSGWVGDEVLLTTGDGGAVFGRVWNLTTGELRTIDTTGRYQGFSGTVPGTDVTALRQGDSGCVAVSHLHQAADLWTTCDGYFSGFSPNGTKVLLGGEGYSGRTQVRDVLTGRGAQTLALPATGVLAMAWNDDTHVTAVVRALDPSGTATTLVVTCPTSGSACTSHDQLEDASTAVVGNARG